MARAARLLRSWVRIPPGAWIFVCCECRVVLSGRGLCDELITRPEESYRLWCVVVCDLETSRMGAPHIRRRLRLHMPRNNVTLYKNCTYYASINIFNSLPKYITDTVNDKKQFVRLLRNFLNYLSFYSVNEFMDYCCECTVEAEL